MEPARASNDRLIGLRRRERTWANLVLLGLLLVILAGLVSTVGTLGTTGPTAGQVPRSILAAAWATAGIGAVTTPLALILYVFRRTDRRRAIESHDWLVCPNCSYPLSGCPPEGRCPECGDPYNHTRLAEEWKRHFRVTR